MVPPVMVGTFFVYQLIFILMKKNYESQLQLLKVMWEKT